MGFNFWGVCALVFLTVEFGPRATRFNSQVKLWPPYGRFTKTK